MTNPPTIHPIGTVISPASIPAPRNGRSSFFMMLSATGIVNTIVGPIIVPRINPAKSHLPPFSLLADIRPYHTQEVWLQTWMHLLQPTDKSEQ